MKISQMNWMQLEAYLKQDDRCILPLGSVEQHGYISLCTDQILAENISLEAAEPLGIPVFPALPYGLAPYFQAYPGSMTLRVDTYVRLVRDLLDSLRRSGFRRVLIVNGHGGNQPAAALAMEYSMDHPEMRLKFHNWWAAPNTMARVQALDLHASHASWMENFPWTRVADVPVPAHDKPPVNPELLRVLPPDEVRKVVGDGNYGGGYQKSDEQMRAIWSVAIEETRALLEGGWSL
jgi:creatinine amidohydrolase